MAQSRKQLKATAHNLKPVVIIGSKGLTEGVHNEIDCALEAHELIKLRVNAADKKERLDMIGAIIKQNQCELVSQVGHVATLYRKRKEDTD